MSRLENGIAPSGYAGDSGEWSIWQQKGDPVTHIEMRKWADCLVIAPLTANTLAKLAQVCTMSFSTFSELL